MSWAFDARFDKLFKSEGPPAMMDHGDLKAQEQQKEADINVPQVDNMMKKRLDFENLGKPQNDAQQRLIQGKVLDDQARSDDPTNEG